MRKIGNYEMSQKNFLGKGSFSIVYKGRYIGPDKYNIKYGKPVAIKIIKTNKINNKVVKVIEDEIKIIIIDAIKT